MASKKLTTAVQLIKSGDKPAAIALLKEILQEDPRDENAWLWLYSCVENVEQKKLCVKKALEINPDNPQARRAWSRLSDPNFQAAPRPASKGKARKKGNQSLLLALGAAGLCLFMCVGVVVLLGLTGQFSALTSAAPFLASPTLRPSHTPTPSFTPSPTVTPTPSQTPTQPATLTPSPVATVESFQVASMESLDSYRAKGKMNMSGFGSAGGISWVFSQEWVKASSAQHIILSMEGKLPQSNAPEMPLDMEIIVIGKSAWMKSADKWSKVDPNQIKPQQQGVSNPLSELKNLTPLGEETINGVVCTRYLMDMTDAASTLPETAGPPMGMRATGDIWIANQPDLPPVIMRMQVQMKLFIQPGNQTPLLPQPATPTLDPYVEQVATPVGPVETPAPITTLEAQSLAYYFEYEITEINTVFTIEPPQP